MWFCFCPFFVAIFSGFCFVLFQILFNGVVKRKFIFFVWKLNFITFSGSCRSLFRILQVLAPDPAGNIFQCVWLIYGLGRGCCWLVADRLRSVAFAVAVGLLIGCRLTISITLIFWYAKRIIPPSKRKYGSKNILSFRLQFVSIVLTMAIVNRAGLFVYANCFFGVLLKYLKGFLLCRLSVRIAISACLFRFKCHVKVLELAVVCLPVSTWRGPIFVKKAFSDVSKKSSNLGMDLEEWKQPAQTPPALKMFFIFFVVAFYSFCFCLPVVIFRFLLACFVSTFTLRYWSWPLSACLFPRGGAPFLLKRPFLTFQNKV